MTTEQQKLLPIGTRVTHFDGGPSTHGKGTIVAYNSVNPSTYLTSNFGDAVEIANEAGMLGAIISMVYDRTRCPYVVHWDVRQGDSDRDIEIFNKYPRGYKDVYEVDSVKAYPCLETAMSIFPNDWIRVMGRQWRERENRWGPWLMVSEELYMKHKDNMTVEREWEFCVRPLPEAKRRYGPEDGSFVPLAIEGSDQFDLKGYHPPLGIFVEFYILGEDEPRYGLTAQLQAMGPWSRCETVISIVEPGQERVLFLKQVSKWRELIERRKFTPALMEYVGEMHEVFNRETISKEPK